MADGFFGRWSRRKQEARDGKPLVEPGAPQPLAPAEQGPEPTSPTAPTPCAQEPALPTLADAQALTAQSDFRPFVARGVAPGVRNAAMKKLFSDPHFNAMDGLDTYIGDYSKPDPLPLALLRQMASAHFLGLVQEDPEVGPEGVAKAPTAPCLGDGADAQAGPDMAQSQPQPLISSPQQTLGALPEGGPAATASPNDHAYADLRLQPDDAPQRESAGRGPG